MAAGWEDPRIVGPTFAGEQAWKTYATDLMAKVRGQWCLARSPSFSARGDAGSQSSPFHWSVFADRAGRGWYCASKSQIVKALLRSDNKEDHEINVLGYLVKLVRMEFARPVGYSSTEQFESQNATP